MQPDRIQDIVGMRIVFDNMDNLNRFVNKMKKSYRSSKMSFVFERCSDYISSPKLDGYRCIHHIYKYLRGKYQQCYGLSIELQIRTKMQH